MTVLLPHVDLMALTACQLSCRHCTNFIGVLPQEVWPVEDVLADAQRAARVMHAETVCILGGEPLSHPHLLDIMRGVRASGLGDRIQILTNGMRLHRMKPEFWAELQWLKISIYPGKTQPENVELAKRKAVEYGFALDFYDVADDPFRAVLTDRPHPPGGAQATFDGCWYKTYTRKIERGYFYRCCTSPQISQTVLGLAPDADGIALEGLTEDALTEFLGRKTHMQSCTRCYGNLGPRADGWDEERDRSKWIAASTVALPMHEG